MDLYFSQLAIHGLLNLHLIELATTTTLFRGFQWTALFGHLRLVIVSIAIQQIILSDRVWGSNQSQFSNCRIENWITLWTPMVLLKLCPLVVVK